MLAFRTCDSTGSRSSALTSPSIRPMSTVSTASAGLFSPAALILSIIPFLAKTTLTSIPVSSVNFARMGSMRKGWR